MAELKTIAIDFDGCLCENCWPEIGEPIQETFERYREERAQGSKFILWTCRAGEKLVEAIDWCSEHEVYLDAVNDNLPEHKEIFGDDTRKIFADEYWDDRAVRVPGRKSSE